MEQHTIIIPGTASYCGLNANQHSSTETDNNYRISDVLGDPSEVYSSILPEKQYRVVDGRLYVVRPGSPPSSQS
jgi:hypothetical protein